MLPLRWWFLLAGFESGKSYGTFGDPFQLAVDGIEKVEATWRTAPGGKQPEWVPRGIVLSGKDSNGECTGSP